MTWLNYHHLYYFWMVAREGSIARACTQLYLTQPTISGQLRSLEKAVGVKLFEPGRPKPRAHGDWSNRVPLCG